MTVSIPPAFQADRPARTGQATQIEQSRAIAEVQAAIVVAQQCPRDIQGAIRDMQESCGRKALADRAFYSFPRAGQNVTGPSVYLARELARCWGNVQYGLAEMRRDDVAGESEMLVFAWDVQTNTRSQSVFIVKHIRDVNDKKTGKRRDPLVDQRDIYENNANNGARRLREAIMSVLPAWFVEEAKDVCWKTLKTGDGKPLPLRVSDAVKHFAEVHKVDANRLERKLGRPRASWTDLDVAQLGVITKSISRGETTLDETFPVEVEAVTIAEISAGGQVAVGGVVSEPRYTIPANLSAGEQYMKPNGEVVNVGTPAELAAEPTEAEPVPEERKAKPARERQARPAAEGDWPETTKPGGKA